MPAAPWRLVFSESFRRRATIESEPLKLLRRTGHSAARGELCGFSERTGNGLAPFSDVEFVGSLQHGLDGGEEFMRFKGLPQHQAADLLDECFIFGFGAITGHEQETPTKGGFNAVNGHVEFVPWKRWHRHVAEHQVEILNHDSPQSFRSIFKSRHFAGTGFKESLQRGCQFIIILEQQDVEPVTSA